MLNFACFLLISLFLNNFYVVVFRDERDNLCFGEYGPDGSLPLPVCDFTFEKQQKLLADHWYIDPFKGKRKHRKNHGRVSFTE
jgi:hypothetical protein